MKENRTFKGPVFSGPGGKDCRVNGKITLKESGENMTQEHGKVVEADVIDEGKDEVVQTKDFTAPEDLYAQLIARVKKYHPSTDISQIEKAYHIASKAHEGQTRKSGEPYIIHPLSVALILADLELDKETIVGGLLHDVVEDTVMTDEEIEKEFGKGGRPDC